MSRHRGRRNGGANSIELLHAALQTLPALVPYAAPPVDRRLLLAGGAATKVEQAPRGLAGMGGLIGATAPAFFCLQDSVHLVAFDEAAQAAGKPVNMPATILYRQAHGRTSLREIRGDALVAAVSDLMP